ncbi:MAG: tectonin domain-containing protein [Rhodospirillales bacterium]
MNKFLPAYFAAPKIAFIVLLLTAAVGLAPAPAAAASYQTQATYTGHAICGAADLRTGKLLPACGFAKATKTGKAVGKCPAGAFFDIGKWACYSCPSGFKRTANAVDTAAACAKSVPAERKGAIYASKHKSCPSGTFGDPRNGGECWQCPAGYGRTMAAVDAWDACGAAFKQARRAEFIDRVCPEGTFGDPNGNCYKCPDGFHRTAAAVTAGDACIRTEILKPAEEKEALTCKAGEHFDLVDGGTCWSCPAGATRSLANVKSNDACEYLEMRWEPTKRATNGLFGIPGGVEIAAQVIGQRKRIDDVLQKMSESGQQAQRDTAAKGWELVNATPEDSAVLKTAVYNHVFHAIKNGAKTKAERGFIDYFTSYVQQSRMLAAFEMQGAWKSWQMGMDLKRASRSGTNLANTFDFGEAPPDMKGLVAGAMQLTPAAAIVTAAVTLYGLETASTAIGNASAALATAIRPYTYQAAMKAIEKSIERGAIQLGGRSLSSAAGASMSAMTGPIAIISAAAIIGSIATEQFLAQLKEEAVINDAVLTAKKPVNMQRLTLTEEGRTELLTNWALMTEKDIKPNAIAWQMLLLENGAGPKIPQVTLEGDKVTINQPSQSGSASAAAAAKWQQLSGAARDVAIGADGTRFHVEMAKGSPANGAIKMAAKGENWRTLSGGATRIAATDISVWVVNGAGEIYRWQKGKWLKVNGPVATDIAVGGTDKEVWILGGNGKAADQGVYRMHGANWQQMSGAGARIAIADTTPWIVNAKGEVWHMTGGKWAQDRNAPKAVDIGASKAGVWLVGGPQGQGGYGIYKLENGKWVRQPGAASNIDVGPDGLPLVSNAGGDIYAMERN